MQEILDGAKAEKRALKAKEIEQFNGLKKSIDEIDATIIAEEETRSMDIQKRS